MGSTYWLTEEVVQFKSSEIAQHLSYLTPMLDLWEPGLELLEEIANGLGCKWNLTMNGKDLKKYVIFDKGTPQYPGVYHVRGFLNGVPDNMTTMIHNDLDYIRNELKKRGLIAFESSEDNDPLVLEIWVGTIV